MSLYFSTGAPATESKLLGDVDVDITSKAESRVGAYTKSIGVKQVETVTVLGTIGAAGAGNATVVTTAAGMTGSPITTAVAVANNDTPTLVAGKVRAALAGVANIAAFFTIGGSGADVVLTKKDEAPNDATMAITVDDGTSDGLTLATGVDTTAGVEESWGSARPVVHSQIRTGLGPPTTHNGQEGDFFHDQLADEWYGPKTAGVWGDAAVDITA
jgi:hypothetical protein